MRRILTSLLPLAILAAGTLARATAQAEAPPDPPAAPRPAAALAGESVDETALRYYAATGQRARRDAEARRLQWLHPGWRVPDDLDTEEAGREDEAPLWTLFAADRLDDLDAGIAARRASEPGWQPSAALQRKLARKRLRAALTAAGQAGDWRRVVAGAENVSDLDVDLLWTLAEARLALGQEEAAATAFREAVARSHTAQERLVTLRKALAGLSFPMAEPLLALLPTTATGESEAAALAGDITRARIVAQLRGLPPGDLSAAALEAFAREARDKIAADDVALLGWLALDEGRPADAQAWFRTAMELKPDPVIAHGLALAQQRQGRLREAEDTAFAWRAAPSNAQLFLDIGMRDLLADPPVPVDAERLRRFAGVARTFESADAAQALAWYAYRGCQFPAAAEWFRLALAWHPRETTAKGMALTLARLGRRGEAGTIVNRYDGLFPGVVALAFDFGEPPDLHACPGAPTGPALRTVTGAGLSARIVLPFPVAVDGANPGLSEERRRPDLPAAEKTPLVARRVPGVGPMPYERLGFRLLPGWTGSVQPTVPALSDRAPASGTMAATEPRISVVPAGAGLQTAAAALSAPGPLHGQEHARWP